MQVSDLRYSLVNITILLSLASENPWLELLIWYIVLRILTIISYSFLLEPVTEAHHHTELNKFD